MNVLQSRNKCIHFSKWKKKRNELVRYKETRRNLKCILLSERRQSEKATFCTIQQRDILEKSQLWRPWKVQGLPETQEREG